MPEKLSWGKIRKLYNRQWVQLIDYDWPEEEALPRRGIVRAHAKSRREFDKLIAREPQKTSALLFVGERRIPPGVILSANLHQWKRLSA